MIQVRAILLIVITLNINDKNAFASNDLALSILGFKADTKSLPLYQQAMRDPTRLKSLPQSLDKIDKMAEQNNEDLKSLSKESKKRSRLIARRIFYRQLDTSYFLIEAKSGSLKTQLTDRELISRIEKSYFDLLKTYERRAQYNLSRRERAEMDFHAGMIMIQQDNAFSQGMAKLNAVPLDLLKPEQRKHLQFIRSMYQAHDPDRKTRLSGRLSLEKLALTLPRKAASLAHLAIARSMAGFDWDGQASWEVSLSYKEHMELVSRLCNRYNSIEKSAIFDFLFSVWTRNKGFDGQWNQIPFRINCFDKATNLAVLFERMAIYNLKNNNLQRSLGLYNLAYKRLENPDQRALMNLRINKIRQYQYSIDKDPSPYQESLIQSLKEFRGTIHGIRLAVMHRELLLREIAIYLKKDPKVHSLVGLRETFDKYVTTNLEDPEYRSVKFKFSKALEHFGFKQEAAKNLYNLAVSSSKGLRLQYIEDAIEIQTKLMNWPLRDPLQSLITENAESLERLRQMIELRLTLPVDQKFGSWRYHLNLAKIAQSLDNQGQYIDIMASNIEDISDKTTQAKVLAFLLQEYSRTKNWSKLENLCVWGFGVNLEPFGISRRDSVLSDYYQTALRRQVDAAILVRDYSVALQKISVLLTLLPKSTERNKLLYLSAQTNAEMGKYEHAQSFLNLIESESFKDQILNKTLLENAALSIGSAQLEQAKEKLSTHLKMFPNDPRTNEVKLNLAEVLIAQNEPKEARSLLLNYLQKGDLTASEFAKASDKLMSIGKQMNVSDLHKMDLDFLISIAPTADERARLLARKLQFFKLAENQISKSLTDYFNNESSDYLVLSDLKSQLAYMKASRQSDSALLLLQKSIVQDDDKSVLAKVTNQIAGLSTAFRDPCARPYSSHCAPSIEKFKDFSKATARILNDIDYDKTIPNFDELEHQRKLLVTELIDTANEMNLRSEELALQGNTPPSYLSKIYSEQSKFWISEGKFSPNEIGFLELPKQTKPISSFAFARGASE